MRRIEVSSGKKFGQLTVVREVANVGKRKFLCRCSCGNNVEIRLDHLKSGHTSSCGKCGIEHDGKRNSLKEWAKMYQINESTLRARLKTMPMREALRYRES